VSLLGLVRILRSASSAGSILSGGQITAVHLREIVKQKGMKIILIHADPATRRNLNHILNELNHIVVAEPTHSGALVHALAKHQPHSVIVGHLPPNLTRETLVAIGERVPSSPILWLPDDTSRNAIRLYLEDTLNRLASLPAVKTLQPYSSDQQRLVLHDERYKPFAQEEKLGVTAASQSDFAKEEDLFFRQICCARRNHASACQYLKQVITTDEGLRPECYYRISHASYKAYGWLRENCMRYASVLAHVIEGVELEYLPSPATPGTTLDYLHHEPPIPNLYVASALISHGFRPGLLPGFRSILGMKFTGQPEEQLIADAIILAGWCSFLREVAVAEVAFFDAVLDLTSDWHTGTEPERFLHYAEATCLDFWGFPWLRQNLDHMRELARLAINEDLTPVKPRHFIAPYRDFWKAHLSGQAKP